MTNNLVLDSDMYFLHLMVSPDPTTIQYKSYAVLFEPGNNPVFQISNQCNVHLCCIDVEGHLYLPLKGGPVVSITTSSLDTI